MENFRPEFRMKRMSFYLRQIRRGGRGKTIRLIQCLGDQWVEVRVLVALEVPSGLIPGERNYLLNPAYLDFGKIEIGAPEPFEFDPRVLKSIRG